MHSNPLHYLILSITAPTYNPLKFHLDLGHTHIHTRTQTPTDAHITFQIIFKCASRLADKPKVSAHRRIRADYNV